CRMRDITTVLQRSRAHHQVRRGALALLAATLLAASAVPAAPGSANAAGDAARKSGTDAVVVRARSLLASANQFWSQTFTKGGSYSPAELAFFNHEVRGVCGESGALSGPFYCPADMTLYLDRGFLDQIAQRLSGNEADYALAFLMGHGLGLHIQDL